MKCQKENCAFERFVKADNDYQYHLLYLPRGIERLAALGECRKYKKNTVIGKVGEVPDACYVVKTGRVVCYEFSYSGDQRVYNIMEPGSMFMEECLLFDKPCPVEFKTLEECELIIIDKCNLKRAFKHNIDIVMDVCESLSTKFLSSMEHLRLGPRQSAEWKICKMLLIYAGHYGELQQDGSYLLNRRISHQMMADILGMNRVTVTRQMQQLAEQGLIDKEDGRLCFRDIEALEHHMISLETPAE